LPDQEIDYRSIGLLSAGHLVTDVNQGAVAAMLPFLISAHHLSYTAAAGIVFAVNISSTIVQPLFGHAADRFAKPWLMPVGLFLAGLGLSLTGLVSDYRSIVALAVVSGIGIAAYHPEAARLVAFQAGARTATAMSIFGVGGTLGFALGPLLITTVLLEWGLEGTLALLPPVSLMALVIAVQLPRFRGPEWREEPPGSSPKGGTGLDQWGPFSRLALCMISRSILFYGLNTFIPLYWISIFHQSKAAGGAALTVLAASGVAGNLLGGRLADRLGQLKVMRAGYATLIPLLPALVWTDRPWLAMALLVPIGLSLSATYSPSVVMGQRYLPLRIGLSSGVTLGVTVAIGGVAAPVLGKLADSLGIWWALAGLVLVPVPAAVLSLTLPEPRSLLSGSKN
jgi:FSR family fosmidomycin resistance protein-like MFS transporter